jgi:hypothetical protein
MAREPELVKYLAMVRALEWRCQGFILKHIPRSESSEADELAVLTSGKGFIGLLTSRMQST